MSVRTLACDQAIFTSLRSPIGEGYRIIAASRGLRADEKQVITRCSPSHGALCWSGEEAAAFSRNLYAGAFYAFPSRRLCVAYSGHAGAEHTGRGGHRVYTYNLVFDEADFPKCAYNPFAVLRAMIEAGLTTPRLRPPAELPVVELAISEKALSVPAVTLDPLLGPAWRAFVLQALFEERPVIIELTHSWLEATEALLLGVPGPMRPRISFGAGVKFSIGRPHRLFVVSRDPTASKPHALGRPIRYVDPPSPCDHRNPSAAWFSFVERHWKASDVQGLNARTSRDYSNLSPVGRERFGRLYNQMDAIPQTQIRELLHIASMHLGERAGGLEGEVIRELITGIRKNLLERLSHMVWSDVSLHWPVLCGIWRQSEEGCAFAQPLIERALEIAAGHGPMVAAEAALESARNMPLKAIRSGFGERMERVLTGWAEFTESATHFDVDAAVRLCDRWVVFRPHCPILQRIRRRCLALSEQATTTSS